MLCFNREIKGAGNIPKADVKSGLVAPMSKPGNLRGDVEAFPRSPQRGSHDAFLGDILIVHFQAGKVLAQTQQMGDGVREGDAACLRTGYTR